MLGYRDARKTGPHPDRRRVVHLLQVIDATANR
jgi:hypothetical protein